MSDKQKKVASSVGMKRSVETSKLLHFRAKEVVPDRVRIMRQVSPRHTVWKFQYFSVSEFLREIKVRNLRGPKKLKGSYFLFL